METTTVDWSSQTVIEKKRLGSYIFEFDSDDDFKLDIINYEIEVDEHGKRKRSEFLDYLSDKIPEFIFSEPKRDEIRDDEGTWPYKKARRKVGEISNKSDGFYSELLLYLIMEGFFDFPLVSHKMAVKEDYNTQVKGADGLYIGVYDEDEVIGYGEAKFYQSKSDALDDAIKGGEGESGLSEYHGVDGITEREAEIDVSRENISQDLGEEEINRLLDTILTKERNVPIIHPILIAYEKEDYADIRGKCTSRDEALEVIQEFHDREKFIDLVKRRTNDESCLRDTQLLVCFLRVEDTNKFKDDLESLI